MCKFLFLSLMVVGVGVSADDLAPATVWVKTVAGSGVSSVTAAASDGAGNLYVAGNTNSLDFPVTDGAAQRRPGGSPLVRVNSASGTVERILAAGLSTASCVAADPQAPATLYA